MILDETFAAGTSIIHRIDPRHRVAVATVFSSIVAVSTAYATLVTALVLSILLVAVARLDFGEISKRVLLMLGFVLFIWAVLPFTYGGESIFRIGPLSVAGPGVHLAAQITLKSIAILLVFIALVATMSVPTLGHALNRFRLPNKWVFLLLITFRYFSVIDQEYQRLVRAVKIRGFRPRTNLHTYRTYAYLVGMLFVRAAARATRVYQAMQCRGFKGTFHTLHEFPSHRGNLIFSSTMGLVTIGLACLEWGVFS